MRSPLNAGYAVSPKKRVGGPGGSRMPPAYRERGARFRDSSHDDVSGPAHRPRVRQPAARSAGWHAACGPADSPMRSSVPLTVTLLLLAALWPSGALAQAALDRAIGLDSFGKPLVLTKLTAADIGSLAAAARVPMDSRLGRRAARAAGRSRHPAGRCAACSTQSSPLIHATSGATTAVSSSS